VCADANLEPWLTLPAFELCDTVTGSAPHQSTRVQLGWTLEEFTGALSLRRHARVATMTERDAPLYEEEWWRSFWIPWAISPLTLRLRSIRSTRCSTWSCAGVGAATRRTFAWNCDGLRTAVRATDTAWTAELAIPFRSLIAEPPDVGAQWRANFHRIDRPEGTPRELSAWSPTGLGTFHVPERFGLIEFRE